MLNELQRSEAIRKTVKIIIDKKLQMYRVFDESILKKYEDIFKNLDQNIKDYDEVILD